MKKLLSWLLALVLAFSLCIPAAAAHPVPDPERKGTITVTMEYDGQPVSGGTLNLYRVGIVQEEDGNYTFVPAQALAGSISQFGDLASVDTAQDLQFLVRELGLAADAQGKVGENGVATFTDLEQGLWLVVQTKAAPGYEKAFSFLVSLPYYEDGAYVYEVDASPKTELEKKPEEEDKEDPPPGDKIPQTGQLNWPVPLLSVCGLVLVSAGWLLKKKAHEE